MFLPHFDVFCDLLLDRCTATWNLVLYNKELNFVRIGADKTELQILQILKKMLEKSTQFLSSDQPSEPKLAIVVNLEAIQFEFWTERSISDSGNLCPLWSVILKSVWNSVGDTFSLWYSSPWAVLYSLLCREIDWNIRIRKQGYDCLFYLKIKEVMLWCFAFLTSISVSKIWLNLLIESIS